MSRADKITSKSKQQELYSDFLMNLRPESNLWRDLSFD
jgi:hypothetical protein